MGVSDYIISVFVLKGVLKYFIHDLKWNATHGCPIYYALHYKNMKALELLLDAGADSDSLVCLSALDSQGLTALHVSAKSKAAGFARVYSRLLNKRGFVGGLTVEVMDLLGLSQNVCVALLLLRTV